MDIKSNVTYLTLGGFVELNKYRYVYFVIMFILFVLIICCNSMIVYLIFIHQNLHEPMYVFIAALSLNSVLFSTAMYPKLLIDFLSDKQIISYPACLFQVCIYYSLFVSDFLLLATMAYDRYVSVCKPLQYPTIMRKRTVTMYLLFSWILPPVPLAAAASLQHKEKLCSFTVKGMFCNSSVLKLQCVISTTSATYGLIGFISLVIVSVLFILFTYAKILKITYKCATARKKAAETCLPHLLFLFSFSCLGTYDLVVSRVESDIPTSVHSILTLQVILCSPMLNPLIYGLKMREISKHLKKMLFQVKLR